MGEEIFNRVEEEIMGILNNFSKVLDVEIEVVNEEGIRLFGTGLFRERINSKVSEPIYDRALRDLESKIIENPKHSKDCEICLNSRGCIKKILLCTPIFWGEKRWGVMAIMGLTEIQREKILKNILEYREVLETLSEIVYTKLFALGKNRVYKEFFYSLREGSLVIDKNGIIEDINRSAMGMFPGLTYFKDRKLDFLRIEDNLFNLRISGVSVKVKGRIFGAEDRTMIVFEEYHENKSDKLPGDFLVGKSKVMEQLRKQIKQVSKMNIPVLLRGAVGVDKRAFGEIIHNSSERASKAFIHVNCRDELEKDLEKKIFGSYTKGSLDAGAIERARGGTLFIDEIDSMGIESQRRLLDFINRGRIISRRTGDEIEVDTRIMVGTNEGLISLVENHNFLEDLYYKLTVSTIVLPTLENRREDMEEILEYLVEKYSRKLEKRITYFEKRAMDVLANHKWTGNWKEVENTVEYLVGTSEGGRITLEMVPNYIKSGEAPVEKIRDRRVRKLSEVERDEILNALNQYGQDTESKKIIAKKLGIGIATLYRKIENYQIDKFLKNR
ncbi:sigma 54-interacting transcriptional regulator [Cetobacterium sp. SF1]|uniref:sigma 54-interacting transcriptional regulator n=1 Tax=Cetobacterium sp. SF1 TaxID=3417654 RepID=UPI003CFA6CC8